MSKRVPMVMGLVFAGWLAAPLAFAEDKPASVPPLAGTRGTPPPALAPMADAAKMPTKEAVAKDAKDAPKDAKDSSKAGGTIVELKTSEGTIRIELADKEAPLSVKNFVGYVNDKFYDGTVFHRVIDGFMIQGGGYTVDGDKATEKPTKAPIANESKNGLKNDRGTIAMARTMNPDSATAQFFINLVNNDRLNYPNAGGQGYAVFGKVVEGLDVVEKIGKTKTTYRYSMADVPTSDIKILTATVLKPSSH